MWTETETSSPEARDCTNTQHISKPSNLLPLVPHLKLAHTQTPSPHDPYTSSRYTPQQPNMLIIRALLLEGVITTINTLMCVCVFARWWWWEGACVRKPCCDAGWCARTRIALIPPCRQAWQTCSHTNAQWESGVTMKQFLIWWSSCEFWHNSSRNSQSDRFWLISSGEQGKWGGRGGAGWGEREMRRQKDTE